MSAKEYAVRFEAQFPSQKRDPDLFLLTPYAFHLTDSGLSLSGTPPTVGKSRRASACFCQLLNQIIKGAP
jgi:hypothetical protein